VDEYRPKARVDAHLDTSGLTESLSLQLSYPNEGDAQSSGWLVEMREYDPVEFVRQMTVFRQKLRNRDP
jgi:hypothetical protein